ncbi:MAG: DsbA family oxidoreductase [Deltaproteobacteria bacterium]|nr:DsbA family oxidoreductase [Deltaproteobacteria bacterium]
MSNESHKRIEVWSDIACPWCWVGKKNLEAAMAGFEGQVEVVWRAFELDPQAPAASPDPVDYVERLASKYRMSRQEAQAFIDRMTAAGREKGVEIRFDRIRPCNTFNAHRLLSWAKDFGLQDALKERLFLAYMNEGQDVGDASTLARLASEVGLEAAGAAELLGSDAHRDEVLEDLTRARELGVTGVPFFYFGPGLTAVGAQPPAMLRNALLSAPSSEVSVASCTVEGCTD